MIEQEIEEQELFEHHRFEADKGQSLMRLDKFVTARIENATRTKVQKGIELGTVLVNNKVVKSNYLIKPFDVVTVILPTPPRNPELIPEDLPLDIFYEDETLLLINKKAGMVVHPGHNNYSGTLVNGLMYRFKNLPNYSEEMRPGLVHRIDKDTSGLLLIAKTEEALVHLAKQFFDHSISRIYHAIVWGNVKEDTGRIENYLGRNKSDRKIASVMDNPEDGKIAITHYKVIERYGFCTYIQCQLETGRTHQIRAHMKHIGHPLFADESYGGHKQLSQSKIPKFDTFIQNCFEVMQRQALHAKTLGFIHPESKKEMHFESELPEDFQSLLEKFRQIVK